MQHFILKRTHEYVAKIKIFPVKQACLPNCGYKNNRALFSKPNIPNTKYGNATLLYDSWMAEVSLKRNNFNMSTSNKKEHEIKYECQKVKSRIG